ncbi:putative transcription factor/ chromatin remodeling BED-type(Zn) family [Helianthus annuus]|nr:putative transcription factor/ chromatin remodeling BED-type(Zn) family [Helianthus annuus]
MAWEWGEQRDPLKKHHVWCTLCDKKVSGGITRLKQHLTHTGGQVTGCTKVTVDIQKRVLASMKEKDKIQLERKRNLQILRSNTVDLSDEDEDEDEDNVQDVSTKKNVSKKKKFVGASNVRGAMDNMFKTDYGKTTQNTLDRNNPIKEKLKMNAWDKIATWAYAVGLPFNAVRDESFQDMIHAIGEYGRGMPAPSYHNIRVTLMKKRLEETKQFVDSFRPHWEEYGCSIMSDFWTDGKGRCLINFLDNCPRGTVFLKSIDASEHVKNADLIVKMINEVIEGVGEANIVQFITDNGSNFKAAGKILEEEHPKMFWTPCAAHCVNLMIQDIGEKIPKIKSVLSEARAIVVYIYNHGRILNMMRKLTKNKELHRSCVTRFATQFYTLQSIHENRHHIQVLFVSEEWRKSDFANKAVGKKVERIVAKTEFWDNVHLACQVLAPLVDVVRLVDTEEKPCMGYIYDAVSRAKEQIKKNLTDERLRTKVWSFIQTRWSDQLHHPLHAAGCFLNPAIYHADTSKEIRKNADISAGLYVAIDRLVPNLEDNDKVRQDINLYIDLVGHFGSPAATRARTKVAPYIWWRTYGIDTPLLQKFAITVLSQTCSASPCERNWSTFDNLHSKKRNCLLQQKLNDLVFIQYNTRLQRRFNSLKTNNSLDPILLRDVDENDDWVIPTEIEHEDFVNGSDGLLWSVAREAMGGNEDVGPSTRSKRERYRDDDDDDVRGVEVEDLDERLDSLVDVDSEEDFIGYE